MSVACACLRVGTVAPERMIVFQAAAPLPAPRALTLMSDLTFPLSYSS